MADSSGELTNTDQEMIEQAVNRVRERESYQEILTLSDGSEVRVLWRQNGINLTLIPNQTTIELDKAEG